MTIVRFPQRFLTYFDVRGTFGAQKHLLRLISGFLLLLELLMPLMAVAQSPSPQEPPAVTDESLLFQEIPAVTGASRFEQSISEAPAFVSVVTAREIKLFGYRTLADILQSVAGFYTTNDRNYSYLGVRGFGRPGDYNTRVLLLVDGYHRLNDSVYYQAPIGMDFPIDIDLIDRVEIIRGPSSSLYGTNAVFAVINVITKRGRDLKGGEVSGEAGSYNTYKGRLSYGERFANGFEGLASGSYYQSQGRDLYFKEFDRPSTNHGVARDCDGEQAGNFFTKLGFKDLSLSGAFNSREKNIPTAPWGLVFNDPRTKTVDHLGFMDLKYEGSFENQLGLMVRAFYDRYEYNGTYPIDAKAQKLSTDSIILNKDLAQGEWFGGEFQVTKTLWDQHKVVLGAEYRFNSRENMRNYNDQPPMVYQDLQHSSSTTALFAQDEFRITNYLILNAGIRYDYFEGYGNTINPRLGLVYHPFKPTSLKLLYGQAFRIPNIYERYYTDNVSSKANPNLQPETIKTYEAVWEQLLGKYLRFTLAGFYYNTANLIALQTDPADGMLFFGNVQKVTTKGFEAELDAKWPKGIETRLSYSYQDARDQNADQQLTNSPTHQAKFHALLPIVSDKLFLGTELIYTSPRLTLKGRQTDDAYLLNLTLYWARAVKGLDLSCSLYNVLDQKFGEPGSEEHKQDIIYQDGIGVRVKATYSF
jgi:outer membrane receptor for ferrienterochelin and colicins